MERPNSPEFLRYDELVAANELTEQQDAAVTYQELPKKEADNQESPSNEVKYEELLSNQLKNYQEFLHNEGAYQEITYQERVTDEFNVQELNIQEGNYLELNGQEFNYQEVRNHEEESMVSNDNSEQCHCEECVEAAKRQYKIYQRYEMLLSELDPIDMEFYTKKEELLYALACALKGREYSGEYKLIEEEEDGMESEFYAGDI